MPTDTFRYFYQEGSKLYKPIVGLDDMGGVTHAFVAVAIDPSRRVSQLFSQKNTPIKKIFVFLPVEYLVKI
jgi:hypothetical protein